MKTRILFWVVPVLLAAIIAVVFYQISLEEGGSLSTSLEQGLGEVSEKVAESAPETASRLETKSEEESTPEAKEVAEAGSAEKNSQEKKLTVKVKEMFSSPPKKAAIKKVRTASKSTKPSEQAALVETSKELWEIVGVSKKENDLSQWQTIIIQNKHKLDYTILPESSGTSRIVKSGKKLRIQLTQEKEVGKDILSRKKRGKYAVQLLSVERKYFNRAVKVVRDLVHDGYYAYLHRTKEKFENKYWFRIRVGFFKTAEEAQSLGEEIYFRYRDEKELPKNYWAVLPSARELNSELVDFQTQQNRPWSLELPEYTSHKAAITELPDFMEIADFAYLSYQVENKKKIRYRIRLGFFETKATANQHLKQLSKIRSALGEAKPVKL